MPERRWPTDSPDPVPLTRQVSLREQRADGTWTIDNGLPAENLSGQTLKVGQRVIVQWSATGHIDQIISAAASADSGSPVMFVDGRTGALTSPAIGWSITGTGFGTQVPDPPEPPWMTDADSTVQAIAWHPSGKAVAFITVFASDAAVNVYEWIPGKGFGSKYLSMNFSDIEAYQTSLGNTVAMPGATGAQMKFSPNGLFLALVGAATSGSTTQLPVVAFRFSLANGIDWRNVIVDYEGIVAPVNARAWSWSMDGQKIFYGTDGNITGGVRGRALQWNNDPAAGFGDAVGDFTSPDDGSAAIVDMAQSPVGEWVAVAYEGSGNYMTVHDAGGGVVDQGDSLTEDCVAVSWHPSGRWLLAVGTSGAVIYEVDNDTGELTADDFPDTDLLDVLKGGAFNADGSMLAIIGRVSEDGTSPNAHIYTFSPGGSVLVANKAWSPPLPEPSGAVAWEGAFR